MNSSSLRAIRRDTNDTDSQDSADVLQTTIDFIEELFNIFQFLRHL